MSYVCENLPFWREFCGVLGRVQEESLAGLVHVGRPPSHSHVVLRFCSDQIC